MYILKDMLVFKGFFDFIILMGKPLKLEKEVFDETLVDDNLLIKIAGMIPGPTREFNLRTKRFVVFGEEKEIMERFAKYLRGILEGHGFSYPVEIIPDYQLPEKSNGDHSINLGQFIRVYNR
tara:strand:+ start:420 stop:785 length:366 start_codon:yes stop_codon:yes gene_type:complete